MLPFWIGVPFHDTGIVPEMIGKRVKALLPRMCCTALSAQMSERICLAYSVVSTLKKQSSPALDCKDYCHILVASQDS